MEHENSPIPPLLIERAALGELDATELAQLRKRFGSRFDARLEQLVQENKSWSQDDVRNIEIKQILNRANQPQKAQAWRSWFAVPAVAAVACAVLFFVVPKEEPTPSSQQFVAMADSPQTTRSVEPGTRLKGLAPHLTLHRKTKKGQERLGSNAMAKQGDVIQLSYIAAKANFGVIVSIDGVGQTTLHYPSHADESPKLRPDTKVPLDRAYELDDAPNFEDFYFVTYSGPKVPAGFVTQVLKSAKARAKSQTRINRGQKLALPESWSQSSFLLRKPSAPK